MTGPVRRRAIVGLTALTVVCLAAVVLYLGLIERSDEVAGEPLEAATAVGRQRFPERLALLLGVPLTRGDQYEVLTDGDQALPRMIGAIGSAERRVVLQTDSFVTGEAAGAFARALADAAGRGVSTRLIIAGSVEAETAEGAVRLIQDAGGQVRRSSPGSWQVGQASAGRRWLLAVDGTVAFTGDFGIADRYRGHAHDRDHWRATQFRVSGPAAQQIEGAFFEDWLSIAGGEWPDVGPEPDWSAGWTRSLVLRGDASRRDATELLTRLSIAGAERRVSIATSSFAPSEKTSEALDAALARGVSVRVLTNAPADQERAAVRTAGHGLGTEGAIESLLERGLEVHEYQPTSLDARIMVVDGIWSVIGGSGFDRDTPPAGLTIGIHDPDVGERLERELDNDLRQSVRLGLHAWRRRPAATSFFDRLWR